MYMRLYYDSEVLALTTLAITTTHNFLNREQPLPSLFSIVAATCPSFAQQVIAVNLYAEESMRAVSGQLKPKYTSYYNVGLARMFPLFSNGNIEDAFTSISNSRRDPTCILTTAFYSRQLDNR
jgi:hypothetical protein